MVLIDDTNKPVAGGGASAFPDRRGEEALGISARHKEGGRNLRPDGFLPPSQIAPAGWNRPSSVYRMVAQTMVDTGSDLTC